MAEIQLAAGRPSVTSQPGVPLGSKGTLNSSVSQCRRCGWWCFSYPGAHGAGEWLPLLRLFLSEYKHGDCVRSIDTFGLMVWTIVVQSGTEIGHKCTKNFVWNIICKSTITHMVTLGSSPCAHHQGVLRSGFMASPFLNSASDEIKRSSRATRRFTLGERVLATYWIAGWMGPNTSLEVLKNRNIFCSSQESNQNFSVVLPITYSLHRPLYPGW